MKNLNNWKWLFKDYNDKKHHIKRPKENSESILNYISEYYNLHMLNFYLSVSSHVGFNIHDTEDQINSFNQKDKLKVDMQTKSTV